MTDPIFPRRLAASVLLAVLTLVSPAAGQDTHGPTVRAFGFGDVNFLATELDRQEGFQLGQMVGHVNATLDEHVSFFSEISITRRNDGYSSEVERAILRYDVSDALKISVGRFHTPVGYWNTAFHHGSWLQTSVARPEMIKFGGRFIPTHFVGLIVEGTIPTSGLGLEYGAGIGNGRHSNIARGGDAGDINVERAWTVGFSSKPVSVRGLELGVSLYVDRITQSGPLDVDERIFAVHGVWEPGAPEILAEYARVTHEVVGETGSSRESNGFYVQFGYRLPGRARSIKPYVRIERVDPATDDAVFANYELEYEGLVAGVRYDLGVFLTLRAEVRNEAFEGADRMTSLYLQASFVITGS